MRRVARVARLARFARLSMPRRYSVSCLVALWAATRLVSQSVPCFEPSFGTDLALTDNAVALNLQLGFSFPFAGSTTTSIDVTSNGSIWVFTDPTHTDRCCNGDLFDFLHEGASINPLWADLDPAQGGAVWFHTFPGRAVITWDRVVEAGRALPMTFQVQLAQDGTITFWWDANCSSVRHGAIVGVSPGVNAADPGASDLSMAPLLRWSTPTVYELFDTMAALPFDLAARTLDLIPTGVGWLVSPRTGCDPAATRRYGAGCPRAPVVYEEFIPGTFDLGYRSFLFTPNNGGYSVTACTSSCFDQALGADLSLADDALSGPLDLGFDFDFPGGRSRSIDVGSNGFLWLDANRTAGVRCCNSDAARLLSEPPSLCPFWTDLDPTANGAVRFSLAPGKAVITWDHVAEHGTTNLVTCQVQLFADGRFLIVFGAVAMTSHIGLTGFSGVTDAVDPGPMDWSTAVPFVLSAIGKPLSLDPAPGSIPALGSTFVIVVSEMPTPTLGGIVNLGFTPLRIDLSPYGLSGCSLLHSIEGSLPIPANRPSANVALSIPNLPALAGAMVHAQAVTVSPSWNPAGLLTSNGLQLQLGN